MALMRLTVLACQFVQILHLKLTNQSIYTSALVKHGVSRRSFNNPADRALHIRKTTRLEGQHLAIYQTPGIEQQSGSVSKFIH